MASNLRRLNGVVVTMDAAGRILRKGSVFIDGTDVAAVQDAAAPPPAGFETTTAVDTGGTIFPGLMDLHNHLSYNALRLWAVPKKFGDRSQWPSLPAYHQLVTGPMAVLGHSTEVDLLPSIVRYVEAKCLVAGVTTTQGIALANAAGIERYYKGLVRNVEAPGDPRLPAGATHIADVAASDWQKFDAEIKKPKRLLLHLAEGTNAAARAHFTALKSGTTWAITPSLVGIHCAALHAADFKTLKAHGGSMIWSPLSNYLLYGATADVAAAKAADVPIGLGPDWSPTGSKNLLAELKAAHCASALLGGVFSDEELVAMVTSTAARILGWDAHAGSIAPGKLADLVVIAGAAAAGKEHETLVAARETDVALVVIGGVARYGAPALMRKAGAPGGETVKIGGAERLAYWDDSAGDPDIENVELAAAAATLTDALARLPELQRGLATPSRAAIAPRRVALALNEQEDHGVDLRPHLPRPRLPDGRRAAAVADTKRAAAAPLRLVPPAELAAAAPPLVPLTLDPLTIVDDADFVTTLAAEPNLPATFSAALRGMLSAKRA